MIRFLLDDELIELGDVSADLTVLDWLRLHKHRTGTKEGCGSGDCGACTVVVVSSTPQGLRHHSINSCISFVCDLHGKQLLTVESLGSPQNLHPVQQAMADEHGSQCGFCTPGFVMAMYALVQAPDAPGVHLCEEAVGAMGATTSARIDVREEHCSAHWLAEVECDDKQALSHRIDRALGGNLCRCTGYRPIKRAAVVALSQKQQDDVAVTQALASRLEAIAAVPSSHPRFHRPVCLADLAALVISKPDVPLLAGGTDLALEVTQKLSLLDEIIAVGSVPELQIIKRQENALLIGAGVSLNRCLDALRALVPDSESLLLRFGSDQVRNQGTIGGNIGSASPIGDLPPMLLALEAVLILQKGDETREVDVADHFLSYRKTSLARGEFIRAVRLPLPAPDALFAIHKVSKRVDDDISAVCGAFHLTLSEGIVRHARVAFGGMAAIPQRAASVEIALTDRIFDEATVAAAMDAIKDDFTPLSDARASAEYREKVARNLLWRVFLESGASAPRTRVQEEVTGA